MASNINPSLTPVNSLANFRFWCQKVLPLVYDDSLSYYEVLGKMVVQLNDVIDNVNADTENVLTLKDAFLELQTYVNNFFDDIDQLASYAERAEAAQTAANTSAVNAASSASNASASSLAAMDARDTAVAARQAAQASANTASTAATNANTKANEAAQSAITAQTAQASASQSATLAATDRSAAQTAANTATAKADEASTSAANAATLVSNVQESLENIQQNTQDIANLKESIGNESIIKTAGYKSVPFLCEAGKEYFFVITYAYTTVRIYTRETENGDNIEPVFGTHAITGTTVKFTPSVTTNYLRIAEDNNTECTITIIEGGLKAESAENASLIATEYDRMTASKNLATNDILNIKNILYIVTAPITKGGDIIIGTNVRVTNVAELLTYLLNK